MKELAETFKPASSAIFVPVRKTTSYKVREALKGFRGKVFKASLTVAREEALQKVMEQS